MGVGSIGASGAGSLQPTGATSGPASDFELVEQVRAGEDSAFEELYRRYRPRIAAFVRGQLRDDARAEDVTQEAFFSALRRMRATDSEIAFKPWIYEIARNAAIDSYRRTSRAQEVSIDGDDLLRPSDRNRLVGSRAPHSAVLVKERLEHLSGAFDELPDTHHRVLIMRELEGLSYREIGERLELSRPAVESVLFRARRRLEREYEELDTGRRCDAMRSAMGRLAEQAGSAADERRLARHARRCTACRRRARELGVDPRARRASVAARAAALLPLPGLLRRRLDPATQSGSGSAHGAPPFADVFGPGTSQLGVALSERAAALVAAAALAGAGGTMFAANPTSAVYRGAPSKPPAAKERQAPTRPLWREPRGTRFERPAGPRGAARRDAAPHFNPAPPRPVPAATPAVPAAPAAAAAPVRSQPPTHPESHSKLQRLPQTLGLDAEGPGGSAAPVALSVDPRQVIAAGEAAGPGGPQPAPQEAAPVAAAHLATAAGQVPPVS